MKKLFTFQTLFWVAISTLTCFLSCEKKSPDDDIPLCEEPPHVLVDLFTLEIRNSKNLPIIGGVFSEYDPDSIKILNADFSENISLRRKNDSFAFSFLKMPEDSMAYTDTVYRVFFLRLDSIDTDTISTEFKFDYIEECFVTQFDYLKIYYNDSLYYTNDRTTGYPFLPFYKF